MHAAGPPPASALSSSPPPNTGPARCQFSLTRFFSDILRHDIELLSARSKTNATALALAAGRGCVDTVRVLLSHGCSDVDWDAAAAAAKASAATFFHDVYAHEFRSFFERPRDAAAAAAVCRSRFIEDMGEYVNSDSVEVRLNCGACHVTGLFVSRYMQLRDAGSKAAPALRFLWHGCSDCIVEEVLRGGFKTSFANLTFNVYGAGIYFATDAKLSAYFVTTDLAAKQQRAVPVAGKFRIILAAVTLGTVGTRAPLSGGCESERRKMQGDLKHPANRNPPLSCDSAAGPSLKEVVVYDDAMALPFACVSFNLKHAVHLPDPYASNAADNSFLRDLRQIPANTIPQLISRDGCAASVDFSPLVVAINPPLLCGWQPGTTADDSDALIERVAELEILVSQLQRENAQLRALHSST